MISLAFFTPRPSGNGKVHQELRQLRDVVRSLTPAKSTNSQVVRTSMGTIRKGNARGTGGGGGEAVWL